MIFSSISLWLKVIVVAIAGFVGYMTPKFLKKNDTPIEQIAEDIIHDQTDVEIDFSPNDPIALDSSIKIDETIGLDIKK